MPAPATPTINPEKPVAATRQPAPALNNSGIGHQLTERLGPCVLLPIPKGQKGPRLRGWQKFTLADMTESHLASLENSNVGVLLGAASEGLVSVDCDSDEFLDSMLSVNPVFHGSLISRGSRGGNIWLRMRGPFPKTGKIKTASGEPWGEWRSDGSQTVIHGTHPSGSLYQTNDHSPLDIEFDSIIWPPGLQLPWSQQSAQQHELPAFDPSLNIQRARACVAKMPAAVSGRAGHDAAFAVAKVLMHDFALDEKSAYEIFAEFNQRCLPPWTDDEIRHKLRDAAECNRAQAPKGSLSAARDITADFVNSLNSYRVPAPTLAPEALTGFAGCIVRKIEPHTETHPAALLLQLLAGFGNLVGPGPHLLTERDRQRANLFVVVVGDSSRGRKGTSWGHVRSILGQVDPAWEASNVVTGLSSGQGIINHLKDEDGEDAVLVTKDKRLQILETEFGAVLKNMHRDGNILSAILRNAWDTGNLRNLTKESPLKATGCHISLIGHITSVELNRLLTADDAGNGFSNRILWTHSSRVRLLPDGGCVEKEDFTDAIDALKEAAHLARQRGEIKRSPDAADYWRSIYPKLTEDLSGLAGQVTSRAEAQVVRLSLIYCLLDGGLHISLEHLKAAEAVWNYCRDSARWAFKESLYSRDAAKLLAALDGGELDYSTIHKNVFRNNATREEIASALEEIASQIVVESRIGEAGRLIKFVRVRSQSAA
jgi:hypothetical protein